MNGATPLLPLYTFMVLIGKTSLIPPREHSVPFMKTSNLMLRIEIIGVCCVNYTESINTLCEKMRNFSSVQHVVHIVTTELQMANKLASICRREACGKERMAKNGREWLET